MFKEQFDSYNNLNFKPYAVIHKGFGVQVVWDTYDSYSEACAAAAKISGECKQPAWVVSLEATAMPVKVQVQDNYGVVVNV